MGPVEIKDLPGLVGQEVGVSDWVEITQERVNQFAEATGDHQWIHVDVERANREIGVLFEDPTVIGTLQTVTQKDWASRGATSGGGTGGDQDALELF